MQNKRALELLKSAPNVHTSLSDVFVEEPPDLTTFITDRKYLNNPPLSDIQFDAVRHLEQILNPLTYELMQKEFGPYWKPVRFIDEAWIQWGKGSGKDHICRVASARILNVLLCLRSPQHYYGLPLQDDIHTINVATSSAQAVRAFYKPLKQLIQRSAWFSDKADPKETSIIFDKNIEAISGHSGADTQEGLNLILAICDEIAAFRTREEALTNRANLKREPVNTAENIVEVLKTSIRTRFPLNGKLVGISYPRYLGDYIQQRYNAGLEDNQVKGEKSRIYVSFGSTWDVNPRAHREHFQQDYESPNDPAIARAKYECKPELAADSYFRNTQALHAAFSEMREVEPIRFEYHWGTEVIETGEVVEGWQCRFHFAPDFKPVSGAVYCLHGDMAVSGCAAGIAMAHVKAYHEFEHVNYDKTGFEIITIERKPLIKLDFVNAFDSDMSAMPFPREIQIRWFRQLAWLLMNRGFVIRSYTFDGFQSVDTIQILNRRGIEATKLSTDRDPQLHANTRDIIYEGRLEAYHDSKTILEYKSLTKMPNGKIVHVPGGSKDRADAVTGAIVGALNSGGEEELFLDEPIYLGPGEQPQVESYDEVDLPEDLYDITNSLHHGF